MSEITYGKEAIHDLNVNSFYIHLGWHKRFTVNIDGPDETWEFSPADVEAWKLWDHCMKA